MRVEAHAMTHAEALHEHASERYLLGELTGETRESFEEHLFTCTLCADDVQNGSIFLGAARQHFATEVTNPVRQPARRWAQLFAVRSAPAFAVIAALLVLAGYQNFVQVPRLRQEVALAETPKTLTELVLAGADTRGPDDTVPSVTLSPRDSLLLSVDVPAGTQYAGYRCVLVSMAGKELWQLTLASAAAENAIPLSIPASLLPEGRNHLKVYGVAAFTGAIGDPNQQVADYPFQVRLKR